MSIAWVASSEDRDPHDHNGDSESSNAAVDHKDFLSRRCNPSYDPCALCLRSVYAHSF